MRKRNPTSPMNRTLRCVHCFEPCFIFSLCSSLELQVYNQIAQIPEGTARRDALRLTKKKAKSLPRVTAYATAAYVLAVSCNIYPFLT